VKWTRVLLACVAAVAAGGACADDTAEGSGKAAIIAALGLEPHVEGGYFARTFQPDHRPKVATPAGPRYTMTAIHYLLTDDSPIGHLHRNESDIVHFYHLGSPVEYYLLHPDGRLETAVLGPDLAAGQRLQLTVRGGVWKASHLPSGEYGLISEAVAPGFDYADMALGKRAALLEAFPQHADIVRAFTRD